MLEITNNELIFSFPEVDAEAILRLHLSPLGAPSDCMRLLALEGGGIRPEAAGRFVVNLNPGPAQNGRPYREIRYPFVLLISVAGTNAITGTITPTLSRNPQNYIATPPQGGIDGYFLGGRVYPFFAGDEGIRDSARLDITVYPMKSVELAYLVRETRIVPGWGASALRGITLAHGGARECEPLYEDICCIGSWDRKHAEHALVWVRKAN
jgi:hypothetical protein